MKAIHFKLTNERMEKSIVLSDLMLSDNSSRRRALETHKNSSSHA